MSNAAPNAPAPGASEEQKARDKAEVAAKAALVAYHKLMHQNGRIARKLFPHSWFPLLLVALLPLILVVLIAIPVTEPDSAFVIDPAISSASESRLETARDAASDNKVDAAQTPKAVSDALSASGAIVERVVGADTQPLVRKHTIHARLLLFLSVYLVLLGLGWLTIAAQARLIRRHCDPFWPRNRRNGAGPTVLQKKMGAAVETLRKIRTEGGSQAGLSARINDAADALRKEPLAPGLRLTFPVFVNLVLLFFIAVLLAAVAAPHGLPWVMPQSVVPGTDEISVSGLLTWVRSASEPVLWIIAFAIASSLVLTAVHLTAFGAMILRGNFPNIDKISAIREGLANMPLKPANAGQVSAMQQVAGDASKNGDPVEGVIRTFKSHFPDQSLADQVYVDVGMDPDNTLKVVKAMVLPLAVLMVLALITLSLGLDIVEARQDIPAGLATAVAATNDAWVVALGAGFSASLAIIYIWPFVRLQPYVSAMQSVKKPGGANSWELAGSTSAKEGVRTLSMTAKQTKKEPPVDFDDELTLYLGADRGKFTTIMAGANHGAGFHMLMEETLQKQIAQLAPILTLLAPALVGALLKLIG